MCIHPSSNKLKSANTHQLNSSISLFEDVYDPCNYVNSIKDLESHENYLIVMHLNIRSMINKKNELANILEQNSIDIALLSETWLHSDNKKHSKIKDYHIESVERTNKKGGGVAILANQSLTYRRRSDIELSFPLLELCAIEIKRHK